MKRRVLNVYLNGAAARKERGVGGVGTFAPPLVMRVRGWPGTTPKSSALLSRAQKV